MPYEEASHSELCGDCWWLTVDAFRLASQFIPKDLGNRLHSFTKYWQRCHLCASINKASIPGSLELLPKSQGPSSELDNLDSTHEAFDLGKYRDYRGYFRFVITSRSVSIDTEYRESRLAPPSGMTIWETQSEIVPSYKPTGLPGVVRGIDDIIRFTVYKSIDLSMPVIISQRRVADIKSNVALEAAKACLNACLTKHHVCRMQDVPLLPTRVLDTHIFQTASGSCIKLYGSKTDERGHYAALSYCWGGPQAMITSKATLTAHLEAIVLDSCSQSIKDAVTVTRGLGIRYLWIDALCIIQDALSDKLYEVETMGKIYKDATVTIAAASSPSAEIGFLQPKDIRMVRKGDQMDGWGPANGSLDFPLPAKKLSKVWLNHEPEHDHSTEPLSLRGWAFQEQVLSLRLLQYGSKGVTWHCLDADKTVPVLHPYVRYKARSKASRPAILRRSANADGSIGYQLWNEMIEDYSHRSLTFAGDRLLAIAGIASELRNISGEIYLAGHWQKDLVKQLGWRQAVSHPATGTASSQACKAPSWSWASVDGGVIFGARYKVPSQPPPTAVDPDAILLHCFVEPNLPHSPFGDVKLGLITLCAKIIEGPHPIALDSSTTEQRRLELGLIYENVYAGTSKSRWPDSLQVTLDQSSHGGAKELSVDSRRVAKGNRWGFPTAWYLLLGYCWTKSPVGLILMPEEKGRFKRIGYWQSKEPNQPPLTFNERFSREERRQIVIV